MKSWRILEYWMWKTGQRWWRTDGPGMIWWRRRKPIECCRTKEEEYLPKNLIQRLYIAQKLAIFFDLHILWPLSFIFPFKDARAPAWTKAFIRSVLRYIHDLRYTGTSSVCEELKFRTFHRVQHWWTGKRRWWYNAVKWCKHQPLLGINNLLVMSHWLLKPSVIILDNDQLDTHLLYFIIRLL